MFILIAGAGADAELAACLEHGFNAENYAVDVASDRAHAAKIARTHLYDAAILDLNLVQPDDLELLQSIRAARPSLPILTLASQSRPEERARVLDSGADDLLLKPFAFAELSARVRALLRRSAQVTAPVICIDDLELNRLEHCVRRAQKKIDLTPKEFALLEYMMRNCGRSLTREEIIQHVWNLNLDTMTNVVDVYINYVRKKVDALSARKLIHTIRGVGYELRSPVDVVATSAADKSANTRSN